jgi:hypothetical protein
MLKLLKRKLLRWLKERPPKLGLETAKVVAEDIRKIGHAAMLAGLVAVFNPTGAFTLGGAMFLFTVGFVIWGLAIVLHLFIEWVTPKE